MPAVEVDLVVIASRIEEFGDSQGWDGVLVMRVIWCLRNWRSMSGTMASWMVVVSTS